MTIIGVDSVAKIVVVTSGKGGVGKTTTSASFATGLALRGHKTVVIDFDVGLRNLDLIMGCERRVVYDFVNVINNEARLQQALIRDKDIENLYILPASQTRDKDALSDEGVARVIDAGAIAITSVATPIIKRPFSVMINSMLVSGTTKQNQQHHQRILQ